MAVLTTRSAVHEKDYGTAAIMAIVVTPDRHNTATLGTPVDALPSEIISRYGPGQAAEAAACDRKTPLVKRSGAETVGCAWVDAGAVAFRASGLPSPGTPTG
jgi:hypothetical protein